MNCCQIWNKFRAGELLLKKYPYWSLLVRAKQPTLGCCVAILNRHAEALSELKAEEFAELAKLAREAETALKKAFEYDKINYLVLMMEDRHAHMHIIPRYSKEKSFSGGLWIDEGWPKTPVLYIEEAAPKVLKQIKEEIAKNLQ